MEVSGQLRALDTLPPWETASGIDWTGAGWATKLTLTLCRKEHLSPPRNQTQAIEPIACCYAD
jgi:hypothetical protein